MKKIIGIILTVLVVAGMVLLLAGNKKKMEQQTQSVAKADTTEVVTTCTVTLQPCSRAFTSNGVAQAASELNFVSEVSGRVVAVMVDKGSRVSKGSPLLRIDSELLEADYKAALATYESLKKDAERFSRSAEAGGISGQQLDNVRTQLVAAESRLAVSKWKLDNAVVKAPISGTINNRFVEPGSLIAPNAPLFEIVDDSRIKTVCNVSEEKVQRLTVGQHVTATTNGGETFGGTIRNIGVKTDRGLNYPVEVAMDANSALRVGTYLKVQFAGETEDAALLIPRKAVVGSVMAANVFVAENGRAVRREVTLGDMYGEQIEILSGLQEGDEIVVSGLMNISDGRSITVVGNR